MKIDRVIDWDSLKKPVIMNFVDFGGPINFIIQSNGRSKEFDNVPENHQVDFSKIKFNNVEIVYKRVEDERDKFKREREDYIWELSNSTSHENIKPDHLFWQALKSDIGFEKNKTTMRWLMKETFKYK